MATWSPAPAINTEQISFYALFQNQPQAAFIKDSFMLQHLDYPGLKTNWSVWGGRESKILNLIGLSKEAEFHFPLKID